MADVSSEPSVDGRAFRDVMGRFATGVTVVTMEAEGTQRGMTANAVSSVSLNPTLLLVCVDHEATMHDLLEVGAPFAVNILAADQRALSEFFARRNDSKDAMGGFASTPGTLGAPLLDGALAWIECSVAERYQGGDHTIVLGRVAAISLARPDAAPLLFYAGHYRVLADPA